VLDCAQLKIDEGVVLFPAHRCLDDHSLSEGFKTKFPAAVFTWRSADKIES
jgi:hypothetical protein